MPAVKYKYYFKMKKQILVLLGSTKTDSVNQKIVDYFEKQTNDVFEVRSYPIADLPFFNPDLDSVENLPNSIFEFRKLIENTDGVFISTPEYVFSLPAVLKNALEWTVSTMVFHQKPTAIVTAASSGKAAHESIQLIMQTIGAAIPEKCAVLIGTPKAKINTEGDIIDEKTLMDLSGLIENFKKNIAF
jgi:chromate reductase, NAD(P)H dehydrogenase (quinone)